MLVASGSCHVWHGPSISARSISHCRVISREARVVESLGVSVFAGVEQTVLYSEVL